MWIADIERTALEMDPDDAVEYLLNIVRGFGDVDEMYEQVTRMFPTMRPVPASMLTTLLRAGGRVVTDATLATLAPRSELTAYRQIVSVHISYVRPHVPGVVGRLRGVGYYADMDAWQKRLSST